MVKNYKQALQFIHGRTQFKKIPTLSRMRRFLEELGNPQTKLRYIHVTGTNGKGSTVAMIRSMLMASGLTVGTFTSPFITRFNERIQYQAEPISNDDLVRIVNRVQPVVDKLDAELTTGGPTEFEIDTAIMFCYLAEKQPDVVVLEVGIGGLYDSTNVIIPELSVITTVGWDHMKYLGHTLAEIAHQKAGIIKEQRPVVIGHLPASARSVILDEAQQRSATVHELGHDFTVQKINNGALFAKIKFSGTILSSLSAPLGLAGDYQVDNAAVAVETVTEYLNDQHLPVDVASLQKGLQETQWPGRMEVVNQQPLVLLDGAHNLPGMQALVQSLKDDFKDREVYLLVAILADKQYDLMLGELASLGNVHITVTHFAGPSAKRPSADLASLVTEIQTHYPIQIADNWQLGLGSLAQQMSEDDVLLVTGSLYFISEVRKLFMDE